MEKRETEFILQYLRNITSKISTLFERIEALSERVEKLGRACGQAFHQTKSVVNRLAEATEDTRMDLAEYGGTIEAASFFWFIDVVSEVSCLPSNARARFSRPCNNVFRPSEWLFFASPFACGGAFIFILYFRL